METKEMRLSAGIAEVVAGLEPLVTMSELSKALRRSTRQLRRDVGEGRLFALRTATRGSGRLLFPKAEVIRFLESLAYKVKKKECLK